MQYRASFVMMTLGHLIITGIEFLGIVVLFERFESLRGWQLPEVAVFYGTISVGFAIADALARGFDLFGMTVKSGDFDRLLLRPRSTALQLMGQELTLKRIGRLSQGLIILLWGASNLSVDWTIARMLLATSAVLGGSALFVGLLILQATLAFWTTETLEIANTLTYGGVETAQYPLSIYRPWFRKLFTYVVPLACVNYYPILALTGRADASNSPEILNWLAPFVGFAFLAAALLIWRVGVRHYRSTGS
jgi:ABC-2 type transport system permease protein